LRREQNAGFCAALRMTILKEAALGKRIFSRSRRMMSWMERTRRAMRWHSRRRWRARGERCDGDEAEVGAVGKKLVCATRGLRGVELVAAASAEASGGWSKSHMRGAGLRKSMAATRRRVGVGGGKELV